MKHTKEQLEQALSGIQPQKGKHGGNIMRRAGDKLERVYTVSQSDVDVIQSLIQDALNGGWNYNMDEAPRKRKCKNCGKDISHKHINAKFCSNKGHGNCKDDFHNVANPRGYGDGNFIEDEIGWDAHKGTF